MDRKIWIQMDKDIIVDDGRAHAQTGNIMLLANKLDGSGHGEDFYCSGPPIRLEEIKQSLVALEGLNESDVIAVLEWLVEWEVHPSDLDESLRGVEPGLAESLRRIH